MDGKQITKMVGRKISQGKTGGIARFMGEEREQMALNKEERDLNRLDVLGGLMTPQCSCTRCPSTICYKRIRDQRHTN
jgi:hypothetical protein